METLSGGITKALEYLMISGVVIVAYKLARDAAKKEAFNYGYVILKSIIFSAAVAFFCSS